jgi:hypothetical protein
VLVVAVVLLALLGVPTVAVVAQIGPAEVLRWSDPAWRAYQRQSAERIAAEQAAARGDYGPILARIWTLPEEADDAVRTLAEHKADPAVAPMLTAIYRMHPDADVAQRAWDALWDSHRMVTDRMRPPRLFFDEACRSLGLQVVVPDDPLIAKYNPGKLSQACLTSDGYRVEPSILSHLIGERDRGRPVAPLSGENLPTEELPAPHLVMRHRQLPEDGYNRLYPDVWSREYRVWTRQEKEGRVVVVPGPAPIRIREY